MRGTQPFVTSFAAWAVLLLASLANFLSHNDYPLLRPEVLILVAGLVTVSLVAAAVTLRVPAWGRSLLEGLLAALFVEWNTTSLPLAAAAGLAVAAIAIWKRTSLARPMTLFGAVVLVTTLAGVGGRTPWIHSARGQAATEPDRTRPAILHLILDEQIGIEGLPRASADTAKLRQQLRSFYTGRGFATYGGAYSEHMRTMNAIPFALNYGQALGRGMRGNTAVIGPTRYLESLVRDGYRLTIYQADYADFCTGARYFECITYEASSPTALADAPLATGDRAGLIAAKFLSLSRIANAALVPWRLAADLGGKVGLDLPRLDPANLGRSTTPGTLAMVDRLTGRLRNARPGEAYFAHLLLPHYPYAVDENCRLLRWRDWKKRFAPRSLEVRQRAYAAQVRCTTLRIGAALDAFTQSPAGKDGIVIIQGDHGSRITRFDPTLGNVGKFDDADLIAVYSTLFAVRSPTVRPGYSTARLPIQRLLKDFAESGYTKAPVPVAQDPATVRLDGPNGSPGKRVALPKF